MDWFYHNFTKEIINQTNRVDFIDIYQVGDLVYKTRSGNAVLVKLETEEIENMVQEQCLQNIY
jgi:hypothetical protein